MQGERYFKTIKDIPKEEFFSQGHRACQGCLEALPIRLVLKAIGPDVIVISATGCMEVISSPYPYSSWEIPWYHVAFENTAAVASGVEAGLKAMMRKGVLEKKKIHVIGMAGDGGTADIGLQALSGALERGHDMLYVCTDNEAYMNTGIQRSSATPLGAWTTTSPPGKHSSGQRTWKKDMPSIVAAHNIPYVATAVAAWPIDLMNKAKKGAEVKGPAYLHIFSPCPIGWRYPSELSVKIARLGVQTGIFPIYEIQNGDLKITIKPSRRKPVEEYLKLQGRFRHLSPDDIKAIQDHVDKESDRLGLPPREPS
jgi:pyruvate ferredoxin oxidoreductase beta subunit